MFKFFTKSLLENKIFVFWSTQKLNALNKKSKLKVVSASKNRSYARTKKARKKNPKA